MGAATDAMLDPPVRAALGIAEPPRALGLIVHGVLRLRGRMRRFARSPDTDRWTPGQPNLAYPDGYRLDQLGPARRQGTEPGRPPVDDDPDFDDDPDGENR